MGWMNELNFLISTGVLSMGKLLGLFLWIKPRLTEPSSFAALSAVSAMAGHQISAEDVKNVMDVATLVFGALGFFVAEAKPATVVE